MALPAVITAAVKGAKALPGLNARLAKLQSIADAAKQLANIASKSEEGNLTNGNQSWNSELTQESSITHGTNDPSGMNVSEFARYEGLPTWYFELPSIKEVDSYDANRH